MPTLLDQVRKEATPDLQASAKEGPAPAPTTGCIETQVENFLPFTSPASQMTCQTEPSRREVLESTITRLLRPHYASEADARKVITQIIHKTLIFKLG